MEGKLRQPGSLRAVDRAIVDLRRGQPVAVAGGGGTASLVIAAEAVTPESLRVLCEISRGEPVVVLTARRAAVLGLRRIGLRAVTVGFAQGLSADMVYALADPLSPVPSLDGEADSAPAGSAHTGDTPAESIPAGGDPVPEWPPA